MTWLVSHQVDEFVDVAGDFLRSRPAEHTVLLTVLDSIRARGIAARFGWWVSPSGVAGAFLQTPPEPVVLTGMPPEAVAPLVEILSDVDGLNVDGLNVDGLNVERSLVDAVTALWPRPLQVRQRFRLHRLGSLTPPLPGPPGRARIAGPADRELLISWYGQFLAEVGYSEDDLAGAVDYRIGYGGLTVWEVDGVPVSMASRTQPAAGMLRVGPVYTPVALRQRGYAGAVTAAVSRAAQELVDEVLLFTDLANPTSNALYQRIGYRPVHDRVLLALTW